MTRILRRIKWPNLAVFVGCFALAELSAWWLGIHPTSALLFFGFGVLPCWFVVRMGWIE